MKFDCEFPTARESVFVPPSFAGPDQVVENVKLCEELGFHAVWGTDFVSPTPMYNIPEGEKPNWYEPLITLAYCAAQTQKIKLATGLLLAPLREVVILAKQVATLDQFSKGRMWLGLGLGMCRDEFDAINPRRPKAHRGDIMEELIEVLQRLFSDEVGVTFESDHHAIRGVSLYPKPVQKNFPIYVPLRTEEALERIARLGLNVTGAGATLRQRLNALEPYLAKYGRKLSDIDAVAEGEVFFGKTKEDAIARYQKTRHGQFRLRKQPLDALVKAQHIGTVDDVVEGISRLKENGINHFNILHIPGDTLEERTTLLRTFAAEVMPKI